MYSKMPTEFFFGSSDCLLAKILLDCLNVHLDQAGLLPETRCGFRKDRGTIDMTFTARQLQVKCQEENVDVLLTFVHLTKAFDTVSRDGLWKKWQSLSVHPDA